MTSRTVRETYVSNLVSFRVKTTKLRRFYGSREKDEIVGNGNREKDGQGDGAYLVTQMSLSAHLMCTEIKSIQNKYESDVNCSKATFLSLFTVNLA